MHCLTSLLSLNEHSCTNHLRISNHMFTNSFLGILHSSHLIRSLRQDEQEFNNSVWNNFIQLPSLKKVHFSNNLLVHSIVLLEYNTNDSFLFNCKRFPMASKNVFEEGYSCEYIIFCKFSQLLLNILLDFVYKHPKSK